ncbi:hypothetical protein OHS71_12210 [Streptomyces sp. NBC_00377]|uniref:hypothetical protein n=1 Tax=unclassified Streptomyces TaxID=2593676 RepID=UPI002E2484A3|nr:MULTISPECIES: hypothetical protein [unclassified Streptomyces]
MPLPLPSRTPSGPRRRSLLASAAGAALLVGCTSGTEQTEESESGTPSATERARARAAQESSALVARYDAVLAVHPSLAGRLEPLRAEVVRHVEAFGGAPKASPSATGSVTDSPTVPPTTSTAAPPAAPTAGASAGASTALSAPPSSAPSAVPITDTAAVASLAADERALADRRATELMDAPGELARLLASVAAAGAAHAYLLTEGTR